MNTGRYHPELFDPEYENSEESKKRQSRRARRERAYDKLGKLGSYRAEIVIELLLIVACTVLGVAFHLKFMITLSLLCMAVAIPDIVTGVLCRLEDPERKHGKALMHFFVAAGLLRTATIGLMIFFGSFFLIIARPARVFQGLADVGAVTGLLITVGVLIVVFPITFVGAWHARNLKGGVFFCRELTKLRKMKNSVEANIPLDPIKSLRFLALGSSVSVAVFSITGVVVLASMIEVNRNNEVFIQLSILAVSLAQLVIPVVWYVFFNARFIEPWRAAQASFESRPLEAGEIDFL